MMTSVREIEMEFSKNKKKREENIEHNLRIFNEIFLECIVYTKQKLKNMIIKWKKKKKRNIYTCNSHTDLKNL